MLLILLWGEAWLDNYRSSLLDFAIEGFSLGEYYLGLGNLMLAFLNIARP